METQEKQETKLPIELKLLLVVIAGGLVFVALRLSGVF